MHQLQFGVLDMVSDIPRVFKCIFLFNLANHVGHMFDCKCRIAKHAQYP